MALLAALRRYCQINVTEKTEMAASVGVSAANGMEVMESKIFEAISTSNVTELKSLISQYKKKVDFCDENGMTPLQYASYKGSKEMVQMLLDQGADVNCGQHQHNYTALHFGALSGSAEVCQLLMLAGAKPLAVNSVNRTATQMAAFVGNHHIVATINNFVPKSDIDPFIKPQGTQTQSTFDPTLGEQLHRFVMEINLNPIRIALNLQKSGLCWHMAKLKNILQSMCSREMKKSSDINEVMAFKFHYLGYIVGEIHKIRERHIASKEHKKEEAGDEKKFDFVELFSKKLLKTGKDGVTLEFQDAFLKEGVREFPFRECTIFHQMITALTSQDPPSALSVVTTAINGQRGFVNSVPCCNTCGEEKPGKKCSKCKAVQYCDRECQRLHWFVHKKACNRLASTPVVATRPNVDAADLSKHLQDLMAG